MEYSFFDRLYDTSNSPAPQAYFNGYQPFTQWAPIQGVTKNLLFDPKKVSNRLFWSTTPTEEDQLSMDKARALQQAYSLHTNVVLNNALSAGAQDLSAAPFMRQTLGLDALMPIAVPPEFNTPENLKNKKSKLVELLAAPSKDKELIRQTISEITYMEKPAVGPQGFTYADYTRSSDNWFGHIVGTVSATIMSPVNDTDPRKTDTIAYNNSDIVSVLERFDPNFNYQSWFDYQIASDPVVRSNLEAQGVTASYFMDSRNESAANYRLMSSLNSTNIQQKLSTYTPSSIKEAEGWLWSVRDALGNNLDTVAFVAGTIAVNTITGGAVGSAVPGAGTAVGATTGAAVAVAETASILQRVWTGVRGVSSTAWALQSGTMPRYAMQWGVIRPMLISGTSGAFGNVQQEYFGQQNNIALANSVYYVNPEMETEMDYSMLPIAAGLGFVFGAGLDFVGTLGRTALAKAGGTVTPFEISSKNLQNFFNRNRVGDHNPITKAITEALAAGRDPTITDINYHTSNKAESVETLNSMRDADELVGSAAHPNLRRQVNEDIESWLDRSAGSQSVTKGRLILDAVAEGGRYGYLDNRSKLYVAQAGLDAIAQIEARETKTHSMTLERIKDFATMRKEINAEIKTVAKRLTKEDRDVVFKAYKERKVLPQKTVDVSSAKAEARTKTEIILDKALARAKEINEAPKKLPKKVRGLTQEDSVKLNDPDSVNLFDSESLTPDEIRARADWELHSASEDALSRSSKDLNDPIVIKEMRDGITKALQGVTGIPSVRRLSILKRRHKGLTAQHNIRIKEVLADHRAFLKNPTEYSEGVLPSTAESTARLAFFNKLEQATTDGHITHIERVLVLAAMTNRNMEFVPKDFTFVSEVSGPAVGGTYTAGSISHPPRIEIKPRRDTSVNYRRIATILHEIGHSYAEHTYGKKLYDIRELFFNTETLNADLQGLLGVSTKMKNYRGSGTDELMAEVFAISCMDRVVLAHFEDLVTKNRNLFAATLMDMFSDLGASLLDLLDAVRESHFTPNTDVYTLIVDTIDHLDKNARPAIGRLDAIRRSSNYLNGSSLVKGSRDEFNQLFTSGDVAFMLSIGCGDSTVALDTYLNMLADDPSTIKSLSSKYQTNQLQKIKDADMESFVKFSREFLERQAITHKYLAQNQNKYISGLFAAAYDPITGQSLVPVLNPKNEMFWLNLNYALAEAPYLAPLELVLVPLLSIEQAIENFKATVDPALNYQSIYDTPGSTSVDNKTASLKSNKKRTPYQIYIQEVKALVYSLQQAGHIRKLDNLSDQDLLAAFVYSVTKVHIVKGTQIEKILTSLNRAGFTISQSTLKKEPYKMVTTIKKGSENAVKFTHVSDFGTLKLLDMHDPLTPVRINNLPTTKKDLITRLAQWKQLEKLATSESPEVFINKIAANLGLSPNITKHLISAFKSSDLTIDMLQASLDNKLIVVDARGGVRLADETALKRTVSHKSAVKIKKIKKVFLEASVEVSDEAKATVELTRTEVLDLVGNDQALTRAMNASLKGKAEFQDARGSLALKILKDQPTDPSLIPAWRAAPSGFTQQQVFNSLGRITKDAGVAEARIKVVGAKSGLTSRNFVDFWENTTGEKLTLHEAKLKYNELKTNSPHLLTSFKREYGTARGLVSGETAVGVGGAVIFDTVGESTSVSQETTRLAGQAKIEAWSGLKQVFFSRDIVLSPWEQHVLNHLAAGTSYKNIVELARKEAWFKKQNLFSIDNTIKKFHVIGQKIATVVKNLDLSPEEASAILSSGAPLTHTEATKLSSPIPSKVKREMRAASDAAIAAERLETRESSATPTSPVPVIDGKPAMHVVLQEGEVPTGLSKQTLAGPAQAAAGAGVGTKTVAVSSKTNISLIAASNDTFRLFSNTGRVIIDGLEYVFPALRSIESILLTLDEAALNGIDVKELRLTVRSFFEKNDTKGGVKHFLAAMKEANISGVVLYRPNGDIALKFVFSIDDWVYGGYVQALATVSTDTATPTAPKIPSKVTKAPDGTTVPLHTKKDLPITAIKGGSRVVAETEVEIIGRLLTDGNPAMRSGGVDAKSFRGLLRRYLSSLNSEARLALKGIMNDDFRFIYLKFVEINAGIMHLNRERFGSANIVDKFWRRVDEISALEDAKKVVVKNAKNRSQASIYEEAARDVSNFNHKFLPPITEDAWVPNSDSTFKHAELGVVIEQIIKNNIDGMPPFPITTKLKSRVPTTGKELNVDDAKISYNSKVNTIFTKLGEGGSVLLRQNNFISWIFGGSERETRNWWRTFMSKGNNLIQFQAKTGTTLRNMHPKLRALAMLMDDTRATTGLLVGANSPPIKSMARAHVEAVSSVGNLGRIEQRFRQELERLNLTSTQRKQLDRIFITAFEERRAVTAADVSTVITVDDGSIVALLGEYRREILYLNQERIDLQTSTGWRADETKADQFLPIQLIANALSELCGASGPYRGFISSLAATRRQSKMADANLDLNTLIIMGVVDIEDVKTFYTRDRVFVSAEKPNLSNETLTRLKIGEIELSSATPAAMRQTFGVIGEDFFTVTRGDVVTVYNVPRLKTDLSALDLDRYNRTVNGDNSTMMPKWTREFNDGDFVEMEMRELIDFKMKQGRYSTANSRLVDDRPVLDIRQRDDEFSTIQNFTIREVLDNEDLFNLTRTNMNSAYQSFHRYRMFDLKAQEIIDHIGGHTGVRPSAFFRSIENLLIQDINNNRALTANQRGAMVISVQEGMGRLMWTYAEWNGSLPKQGSEGRIAQNLARSARHLVALGSGPGFGMSQVPESLLEILKNSPRTKGLSIPKGVFKILSQAFKVWDRKNPATRYEIEDLATSLEDMMREHSTHFNEGIGDIDFDSGGIGYREEWTAPREARDAGITGYAAHQLQRFGSVAVRAGGIQEGTSFARGLAKARHQGDVIRALRDTKVDRFVAELADPANVRLMQMLQRQSELDVGAERQLWSKFKGIARRSGLNEFTALRFIMTGLSTPDNIKALRWGIAHVGATDGVIDFRDLAIAGRELSEMTNPPINPEVYTNAISSFQYGIENLIRKRSVSHGFGLNKSIGSWQNQETGKLLSSLTSYMRSWQDDVATNAPERGALGLAFGAVLSLAVVETLVWSLREWLAGRELEDIQQEFEDDKSEFVAKAMTRAPVFGVFSPVWEASVRQAMAASGGTNRVNAGLISTITQGMGTGMGTIGLGSVGSMGRTIDKAAGTIAEADTAGEVALGVLQGSQAIIPFNKLPAMSLPVRVLEEAAAMDEKNAAQFIINAIQKPARPYQDKKERSKPAMVPNVISEEPVQTEVQKAKPVLKPAPFTRNVPQPKGVSTLLSNLLDKQVSRIDARFE